MSVQTRGVGPALWWKGRRRVAYVVHVDFTAEPTAPRLPADRARGAVRRPAPRTRQCGNLMAFSCTPLERGVAHIKGTARAQIHVIHCAGHQHTAPLEECV